MWFQHLILMTKGMGTGLTLPLCIWYRTALKVGTRGRNQGFWKLRNLSNQGHTVCKQRDWVSNLKLFWLPKAMLFLLCEASLFHWIIFNHQVRDCLGSKYLKQEWAETSWAWRVRIGGWVHGEQSTPSKTMPPPHKGKDILGQDSWKDVYGKKTWRRLNPAHPHTLIPDCCLWPEQQKAKQTFLPSFSW